MDPLPIMKSIKLDYSNAQQNSDTIFNKLSTSIRRQNLLNDIEFSESSFSAIPSSKISSHSINFNEEATTGSNPESSIEDNRLLTDSISDTKIILLNQLESTNTKNIVAFGSVNNHSISNISYEKSINIAYKAPNNYSEYDSDISHLDKIILKWDYNSKRSFPVNFGQKSNLLNRAWYHIIPDSFQSAKSYIDVFEPLIILEGWAQLQQSKVQYKDCEEISLALLSRSRTNRFTNMTFETSITEGHNISINDILVVCKGENKRKKSSQYSHHFLIKVDRINIEKSSMLFGAISCIGTSTEDFNSHFFLESKWVAKKVMTMTTFYREYLAVKNLASYSFCQDILKRYCEPLNPLNSDEISYISRVFDVNQPQAHTICSALQMNKGFFMIQGPPGTGKTSLILGLVGCISSKLADTENPPFSLKISSSYIKPKIMICAPSNAAVDEVVRRLKHGVKSRSGENLDLKILRIGKLENIQHDVRDVSLDQLIGVCSDLSIIHKELAILKDKIAKLKDSKSKAQSEIDQIYKKLNTQPHRNPYLQKLIKRRDEFEHSIEQYKNESFRIYKERIHQNNKMDESKFALRAKLIAEADVICCTLSGAGHSSLKEVINHVKVLIVDEAGQATEPSCLIPLRFNSPLYIMVGDPQQLPPTVLSQEATKFKYDYSLFARIYKNHPEYAHLLSIQYRMHPEISVMPSKLFYQGKVADGPDLNNLRIDEWHKNPLHGPYVFFDVLEGKEYKTKSFSLLNSEEADAAVWLVESLVKQNPDVDFKNRIGIITPYKQQVNELRKKFEIKFSSKIFDSIKFNTIDGFQGQEKDIIIFSAVRTSTKGIGFLSDKRRINVGLTRAKNSLFIIANSKSLSTNKVWSSIVKNAISRKVCVKWTRKLFKPMNSCNGFSNLIQNALPKSSLS